MRGFDLVKRTKTITCNPSVVVAALLASAGLFSMSSSVYADEDATILDTIVVTASGAKAKLLDTNAAVTILTEKDIKNSGQTKTVELLSAIPGVINQKAGSKTYLSIRGTRGSLTGGPTVYIDGRPLNTGSSGYSKLDTIPLDNIEKIEVIKSAPASKYGANAGRGVILITTKTGEDAVDAFSGYVSGEYGSWDTLKASAGINGAKESFDYSISTYGFSTDGYRGSDEETKTADVQAGYKFDGGRLDFIGGINDSFSKYPKGLPYWQLDRDRTVSSSNTEEDGSGYVPLPGESDEELHTSALKLEYDKNDWLVNSAVKYTRDNQIYTRMDNFNNPNLSQKNTDYRDDRLDEQYDLSLGGGRRFKFAGGEDTLTLGVDYKHVNFDQERSYPFNISPLTVSLISGKEKADIDAERKLLGISADNDFRLGRFGFQAGLRYNDVSYDLSNRVPDSVSVDYNGDIDFNISPSWRIVENANLFVAYNQSHWYLPIGHYKYDMEYDHPEAQAADLEPEFYKTWEIGFKHRFTRAFNYSLILYHTTVEDKLVSFYDGTSFRGYRNAGTSIHKGIEVELDGRPLSWLGYRLSFTTIDAEWDDGVAKAYATPDAPSTSVTDLSGKTLHYVPEYEYAAGIDFFPFQDTAWGSLVLALDVRGFGEQYEDYNNNLKMSDAHFVDLKFTWTFKQMEFYLACTNLFDEEWDKASNSTGKAHTRLDSPSTTGFYPQDGRYIGIGTSFRF